MTNCKNDETEKYDLHDLTIKQILSLNDLLNGCSEEVLEPIRKAFIKTFGYPVNRFKIQVKKRIKLCPYCGGSQNRKVGNLQTMSYDIEPCDACNGEGRRIKITSVRYEMLTENNKINFAK